MFCENILDQVLFIGAVSVGAPNVEKTQDAYIVGSVPDAPQGKGIAGPPEVEKETESPERREILCAEASLWLLMLETAHLGG